MCVDGEVLGGACVAGVAHPVTQAAVREEAFQRARERLGDRAAARAARSRRRRPPRASRRPASPRPAACAPSPRAARAAGPPSTTGARRRRLRRGFGRRRPGSRRRRPGPRRRAPQRADAVPARSGLPSRRRPRRGRRGPTEGATIASISSRWPLTSQSRPTAATSGASSAIRSSARTPSPVDAAVERDAVVDDLDPPRVALSLVRPPRVLGDSDELRGPPSGDVVERGEDLPRGPTEVVLDVQVGDDLRARQASADPAERVRGRERVRVQDVDLLRAQQSREARHRVEAVRAAEIHERDLEALSAGLFDERAGARCDEGDDVAPLSRRARESKRDELASGDVSADQKVRDPQERHTARSSVASSHASALDHDFVRRQRRPSRPCPVTSREARRTSPTRRGARARRARRSARCRAVSSRRCPYSSTEPNAVRRSCSSSTAVYSRSWNGFAAAGRRRRAASRRSADPSGRSTRLASSTNRSGSARCSMVSNAHTTSKLASSSGSSWSPPPRTRRSPRVPLARVRDRVLVAVDHRARVARPRRGARCRSLRRNPASSTSCPRQCGSANS